MFNKLKDNVAKTKDLRKVSGGGADHPPRSRTSSTGSKYSTAAMSMDGTPTGPALLEWSTTDSVHDDSDSASVISSVCHSTVELSELQARCQKFQQLARGFKAKYQQSTGMCKKLQQERDQLRELLATQQTQAFRRLDELREELALDKKAKQDVDVNYNLMLSEKEEYIQVLRLQVSLLKEGKDLPPELEAKITAGQERELQHRRSLEEEKQCLKAELENLTTQLQLTTTQLEEQTVKRTQVEEALGANQIKLQQLQAQADESHRLNRELTDSRLAQSALEEQVKGLKEQLSSLASSTTVIARETEVLAQIESPQTSDLNEPNDQIRLLEIQVGELTKALEETHVKLTESELNKSQIEGELANYKEREPDNQKLREQYKQSVTKLAELEQLLAEKTDELVDSTRTVDAMRVREQDLVTKLNDTRERIVGMKSQLDSSASRILELEDEKTTWKETEERHAMLKQEYTALIDSNRQAHTYIASKLREGQLQLDSIEDGSLMDVIEQLLVFTDTLNRRLIETQSELQVGSVNHTEQLNSLLEQHRDEVKALQLALTAEQSLREEQEQLSIQLRKQNEERESQLTETQLKLSQAESKLLLKEDEVSDLTHKLQELVERATQLQVRSSYLEHEAGDLSSLKQLTEVLTKERDQLLSNLSTVEEDMRTKDIVSTSKISELSSQLETTGKRLQLAETALKQHSDISDELPCLRQRLTTVHTCLRALRSELQSNKSDSMTAFAEDVFHSVEELGSTCSRLLTMTCENSIHAAEQVELLRTKLDATQDELLASKRKCMDLEHSLHSQAIIIQEFQSSISSQSDTSPTSSHLQEHLDELKAKYETQEALLSSRNLQVSTLEEELAGLRQFNSELTMQLQENSAQMERLKTQMQHDIHDWESRTAQGLEQTGSLYVRFSSLMDLVNASLERVTIVEQQVANINQQQQFVNTTLLAELNQTKSCLSDAENAKAQLLEEIDKTNKQLVALKTQFEENDRLVVLEFDSQLITQISSRISRLKCVSASIDRSIADNVSSFATQISSIEHRFEDIKRSVSQLPSVSCAELAKAYKPVELQLDELEATFDRLTLGLDEQKKLADEEVLRLTAQLTSVRKNMEEKNSSDTEKIQQLEQELGTERRQAEKLLSQLNEAQLALEMRQRDCEQSLTAVQQQLDATNRVLESTRSNLLGKESELSNLIVERETEKQQFSELKLTFTGILNQTVASQSRSLRARSERAREWLTANDGGVDLLDPEAVQIQLQSIDQLLASADVLDFTDANVVAACLEQFAQAEQWLGDLSRKANQLQSNRRKELDELERLRASERQLLDKCATLEQKGRNFQEEIDRYRNEMISLQNSEQELSQTRSELTELRTAIADKTDVVLSLESQLNELRKAEETLKSKMISKEAEVESLTNNISTWKLQSSELQQQLDRSSADCAELQDKLAQVLKAAEEEKRSLQESLETAASLKESQLKQQLKEVKTRLKQVLQESEALRKTNLSATNREQELNSQLRKVESELVLQKHECDELRDRLRQLTEQLEAAVTREPPINPVVIEHQALVHSSATPTHNDTSNEFHEELQNATEILKAEHAAHIQEMQRELHQQLCAREAELHAELQKELDRARTQETQLRQSHQSEVDAMQVRVSELIEQNQTLQTQLDQLQTEFLSLEQERKTQSLTVDTSQSEEKDRELAILREQVVELQTKLSQVTNRSRRRTGSPSQVSAANGPSSNSMQGTEYLSSTESNPLDPMQLAKPSDWVEQLRNEIMHADSIDSLHPAVRASHFVHTVSAQDYEALQLHNADLQNQLQQLAAEFEALRAKCSSCNGSLEHGSRSNSIPPYSPSLSSTSGALHEMVEYEYLRNVLFEYMTGRETATLAKVLCSILRFNADQTKRVLQYEDDKSRTWFIQTKVE